MATRLGSRGQRHLDHHHFFQSESESDAQSKGERSVSRQQEPEPERDRQLRKTEREETFFTHTLLLAVDSKKRANDRWLVSFLVFLSPNFWEQILCVY
jgi:ribosomal protein RSM22 (predicted rRNA methylase)